MAIIVEDAPESTGGSDLRSAMTQTKVAPEEAAQGLSRANLLDVPPDTYLNNKDQLAPEAQAIERVPSQLQPETESFLRQSETHLSLASEDIDKMNFFERRAKYYKEQIIDVPELNRDINDIISRKMQSENGTLEPGDEQALQALRERASMIHGTAKDYGIGDKEEFGVEVLSAAGDMIRQYTENKELLLGAIGTGTLIGTGVGLATPAPGGAVVGATAGFAKGAIVGSTLVGFVDGYNQTSSSLFNELDTAVNDQGEPLNIPHGRKVNVSRAVGVISGLAAGLAGKVFASNNPMLKRFVNPKAASKAVMNPAVMARMDVLGGIIKTAMAEGGEEALQELVQIIGGNFGKMDESESSFINALENSVTEAETWSQVAKAGTIGAATGGLVQTVTSAPGYNGIKKRYEEVNYVTERKKEVLSAQNNMLELAQDLKDTKMQNVAPEEMTNFQKKVFSSLGIDENVWLHLEDVREFGSSDPEKAAAIRKVIDPNGDLTKMSQELNTPLSVNKADFLQIVMKFPEITDYMMTTPDGENPLQVRNEGKEFASNLEAAEAKRAAIIEQLGMEEATPEQVEQLKKELNVVMKDSKYFTGRESYLGQSTIQPVEGMLNEKDAEKLSNAQVNARLAIDKSLVDVVDARFEKYAAAEFVTETQAEIENEINKLEKEYQVIDSFDRTKDLSELDIEYTKSHSKKGFSPFAIDPKYLTEAQKAIYIDNADPIVKKNLKARKAFVDGGLNIEEAAILQGLTSGDELLRVLAETPTKKQIENRIKNDPLRNNTRPDQIADSMDDTKLVARDEAFSNLTRTHLKEMDHMVKNSWPSVKRGIIKIASKVPTLEALNDRARTEIGRMKIREINPTAFAQGEKKTHKASVEKFVAGDFEQAFALKEKAALNNEMRKEATKVQDKVARYQKFWKRMSNPSIMQELKDAGMDKTMAEYMSVYKLDGNIKGETAQKAFDKFVKDQVAAGNFVPVVPERLTNTQASYKDLTIEQYQAMTEMGQFILNQAKLKNKLLQKRTDIADLQTQEAIAEDIATHTKDHYNYDENRADRKNENTLTYTDKLQEGFRTGISTVSSLKSIISDLDEQKLDGYFHRLIGKPIKDARTAKRLEISDIQAHDEKIIEQFYGMKRFKEMFREHVAIPEFEGYNDIGDGNGNMRKVDLLVLQAYMGDPDAKNSIPNFLHKKTKVPLTLEDVQRVLDTHLDETDAAFTQNFLVDRFKRFEQRSAELQKRTSGADVEMVKGVPVVHKNKVLPGGYYPIFRKMMSDEMKAEKFLINIRDKAGDLGLSDEGHFFAQMRAAEMTQQGRLKERTGSDRPLDLSFENVFSATEEAVHDLHFREVGIDTLKILKNPLNVQNMKAVVGPKKYAVLLNSVKDTVSKSTERESVLFGEQYKAVNNLIQKAHSLHAIKAIGMNFRSALIQVDSLANLVMRTGPSTAKYLASAAWKMSSNISNLDAFVQMAAEINKDIQLEQDGIDNAVVKHSYDFIPADNTFFKNQKVGKKFGMIKEMQKKFIDASFYFVREADKFNKVISTHALAEKFFNGDATEYPQSRLDKMSDAEKAKALRSYIQQAFDLSLTASATEDKTPLEKNKVASLFVRYWTDRRSRLNSVLAQIDKTKGAIKRGENAQAAQHVLTMSLALGVSSAFISAVRDDEESVFNKVADARDMEDYGDVIKSEAWRFATAPIDLTLDTVPLVDNIKYQSELKLRSDYRNVSNPLYGVMSDMAAGVVIVKDVLGLALEGRTKRLNTKQRKIILSNVGYVSGGLPTNAMYKAFAALNDGIDTASSSFLMDDIKELHERIDTYIDVFGDDKEAQPFIEELKEYKKELPQFDADVKNILPENAKEDLKTALSGGQWNKMNKDTGAAGIFQFTENRWKQIAAINPDLGLTENGRVAKDSSQQEKAMDWEITDNTRGLLAYGLEVSTANLLGAHEFGFDTFVAIASSSDGDKLTDAIGEDAKRPELAKFKTVGEVRKYLSNQLRKS